MATLYEDDIIKKRLLIEGDSGNEDRLINKLTKNFVKWATFVQHADSTNGDKISTNTEDDSSESLYEQMMISLSHAEFGLLRNHLIFDMNKMEQDSYKVLYDKIDNEIEKAEKKIIESKLELQEAKKIRKNRQEYDILARKIQNYPDRMEMQTTIKNLEEKVENLKKMDYEYNKKIELRRKQFSVVLQSLSALKNLVENDLKLNEVCISGGMNEDTAYSGMTNNKNEMGDDMEDDAFSLQATRHDKQFTANEVEMEEAN